MDGKKDLDFGNILKKVYIFIKSRKQIVELATINIKSNKMSDMINKSAKKNYFNQLFSGFSTFSNSIFQILIILFALIVITTFSQNEKKIDNLINIMQTLVLSIYTLQNNNNVTLTILQLKHLSTNAPFKLCIQTNFQRLVFGKR